MFIYNKRNPKESGDDWLAGAIQQGLGFLAILFAFFTWIV
jgi:hypothetical protein